MATPLGLEIFTVVTGPLRLLDAQPKPIAAGSYQAKSASFQKEIDKTFRAFLKADSPEPDGEPPPEYDYFDTNSRVSRAFAMLADMTALRARLSVTAELPDPS